MDGLQLTADERLNLWKAKSILPNNSELRQGRKFWLYGSPQSEGEEQVVLPYITIPEGETMPTEQAIRDAINNYVDIPAAYRLLDSTDWKVIRHRDQLAAGVATTLSEQEYNQLLSERQAARELIP